MSRFIQIIMVSLMVISSANGNLVFGSAENETFDSDFWTYVPPPIAAAVLALVGTAIIGPLITKVWKDRERNLELELKELQFKNTFVGEISGSVMRIIVVIMEIEEYLSEITERDNDETKIYNTLSKDRDSEFKEFLIKGHVIQSEIQAYYGNEQLGGRSDGAEFLLNEWNKLMDSIKFIKQLSEMKTFDERRDYIKDPGPIEYAKIDDLLKNAKDMYFKKYNENTPVDEFKTKLYRREIKAWYEVKHAVVEIKDRVIGLILKKKILHFHTNHGKFS